VLTGKRLLLSGRLPVVADVAVAEGVAVQYVLLSAAPDVAAVVDREAEAGHAPQR